MVVKEKRQIHIQHVHLKFGVALAISVGGIIHTFFKIKPYKSKSLHLSEDTNSNNQANSIEKNVDHDHEDDHGVLQGSFPSEISSQNPITSEDDEQKREITSLQSKIKILEDRETNLEIRLLEYYGLKDQETAIVELQNRLRLSNMEAELYTLKIESLKSDNERLEAQVTDYAKLVHELDSAKLKIRVLKKKLRFEAEKNRDHILSLQERVMKVESVDEDVEMQIIKRNELKEELEEMKKSNKCLESVNSDLAQKLEYVQMLVPSHNEEVQELKEENKRLKLQNEDLTKEIEQIQVDRSKDIEELVYLRWMNASLCCELRSYRPGDLTQKLSPEKPENFILEYSNKDSLMEKGININTTAFDPDQWTSSQASSCLTDVDENEVDTNTNMKNSRKKTKVFSKLKSLLSIKGNSRAQKPPLQRAVSVDNIVGKYFRDSSRRSSFDSGGQICSESSNSSRRASEDGSSSVFGRMDSLTEDDNDCPSKRYEN